ncbi:NAD-binding protein, partial [Streptomyces rectiviolaceus]
MVVCGDDALAERLAAELRSVYRERVTVVVPSALSVDGPRSGSAGRARAVALLGRMQAVMARAAGAPAGGGDSGDGDGVTLPEAPRVLEAPEPDEAALIEAGVQEAAALALVYDDDETNIHAALVARRLNPRLRIVIRLYNRKLGQHLEELLDQAAAVASPGLDPAEVNASTTVLSDADTAAPALAATAVAGTSKVVQADGLLLRAVERDPPRRGGVADPGLCTLALLSSTTNDPAGTEGSDDGGQDGPLLLPDDGTVASATGRGTVVLKA